MEKHGKPTLIIPSGLAHLGLCKRVAKIWCRRSIVLIVVPLRLTYQSKSDRPREKRLERIAQSYRLSTLDALFGKQCLTSGKLAYI